jgi:hypothetical protein
MPLTEFVVVYDSDTGIATVVEGFTDHDKAYHRFIGLMKENYSHPNLQVNLVSGNDLKSREDLERQWRRWFRHKGAGPI